MLAEGSLSMADTSFIQRTDLNESIDDNGVLEGSYDMETSTPIACKKRKIDETVSINLNHNQIDLITDSPAGAPPFIKNSKRSNSNNIRSDLKKLLHINEDLSKYFHMKSSNSKLILVQGQTCDGPYRNHPDTIKELNLFFNDLRVENCKSDFNFVSYMRSKHLPLLAKLVQDSQVPQSELLSALASILFPIASGIPEYPIDFTLLEGYFEKVSYGHPEGGNNFSALSCTFWQVKDIELLGEQIGKHFLTNFVLRQASKMILENCLSSSTNSGCINLTEDLEIRLPMDLMKIDTDGTSTPKREKNIGIEAKLDKTAKDGASTPKREKAVKEQLLKDKECSASVALSQAPPQVKISSFFAKLKKSDTDQQKSVEQREYFQPFFVKPSVSLSRFDELKTLKCSFVERSKNLFYESFIEDLDLSGYWSLFRKQRIQIPYVKSTCLCVGLDGRASRNVLKMLKFEENYRPAYLGTWRKRPAKGTISSRRPFYKLNEIDYEYDSDAEWDEGEDPEGENLSDMSEEDEEDCDDEVMSSNESEDSWLVPHGYLSDDEGGGGGGTEDILHPGELEEAEKDSMSTKRREKRKFVPKEALLLGPFLHSDQIIPQILQSSSIQFIENQHHHHSQPCIWMNGINPFSDYELVFSSLESSRKPSSHDPSNPNQKDSSTSASSSSFPNHLLSSLINIITKNPSAGINKLFDEFILEHGKIVSRRLFESKLNQITTGKLKCTTSGKLKWCLKQNQKNENENKKDKDKDKDKEENRMDLTDTSENGIIRQLVGTDVKVIEIVADDVEMNDD